MPSVSPNLDRRHPFLSPPQAHAAVVSSHTAIQWLLTGVHRGCQSRSHLHRQRSHHDFLRARMIEQMQLHRKAPGTQDQYVQAISRLAAYYQRSPDQLSSQEIRHYLHHLLTERQLAWSSCNVVAAAIRVFLCRTPWAGAPSSSTCPLAPPPSTCPACSVSNSLSTSLPPPIMSNTAPY